MGAHHIKVGLDLPITGDPKQEIGDAPPVRTVAIMATDYLGMKPAMSVKVGDVVKRGQLMFEDRKTEGVRFTSPAAGEIMAINRGAKRALQSIVIKLSEGEASGEPGDDELATFESYTGADAASLSRAEVQALLVESGMWTALRARPYSRTPSPTADAAHSIFVTASDTHPLAPSVDVVMDGQEEDFARGLEVVAKLTEGKTYLCKTAGSKVGAGSANGITVEEFSGVHPAGTVGLHIHTLDPVCREKVVWHIGYQDVIAVGKLFATGKLPVDRIISLAGPLVRKPRLLRTRVGAALEEIAGEDELHEAGGETRVISGSVLHGRTSNGDIHGYLGRFHQQVTVLGEPHEREFMRMVMPGAGVFSTIRAFLGSIMPGDRKFPMNAGANGSHRAMVPIGMYERVLPMDLMATHLLRAVLVNDTVYAETLGVLELDEEDLALCTFVCPCKNDYCSALRETLTMIEKEG